MEASDQPPTGTKPPSAEAIAVCGNVCSSCPKRFTCPVAAQLPARRTGS